MKWHQECFPRAKIFLVFQLGQNLASFPSWLWPGFELLGKVEQGNGRMRGRENRGEVTGSSDKRFSGISWTQPGKAAWKSRNHTLVLGINIPIPGKIIQIRPKSDFNPSLNQLNLIPNGICVPKKSQEAPIPNCCSGVGISRASKAKYSQNPQHHHPMGTSLEWAQGIPPSNKIPAFPKVRLAGCVGEDESIKLDF